MADLTALCDVGHFWGSDVQLSPTGDLARVTRGDRSKQRVLRRLLTNPGDCLFHPEYGAGLPRQIGLNADVAEIRALIREQMLLEASVARDPEPQIVVRAIQNGIAVSIVYVALPDRQPVPLSFDVSV
jgi:hypothetical protein